MTKGKSDKLPKFDSPDKLVEFFSTHDMGEYWDKMPEAHYINNKENAFFPSRR